MTISGISGIGTAKVTCTSASTASSSGAQFFTDGACTPSVGFAVAANVTSASGSCTTIGGTPYTESIAITCNGDGAFAMAALPLPLMALLALLAAVSV